MNAEVRARPTTVTLSTGNRDELRDLQRQLAADRGRNTNQVTVDEAIEYLFEARRELVRLLAAEYGGGT